MEKYRLVRRSGVFYAVDRGTRNRLSLKTRDRTEALRVLNAKNESHQEPLVNLQIARAYLVASDPANGHADVVGCIRRNNQTQVRGDKRKVYPSIQRQSFFQA